MPEDVVSFPVLGLTMHSSATTRSIFLGVVDVGGTRSISEILRDRDTTS